MHHVVREHLETVLTQAADLRDGEGLPSFVEQEFRDFLRCCSLGGGFARFRCVGCGFDRLVPFSCHGRGFCPSCGGRRMAERAAHLVDKVFPPVPVRQWVLSLPHRLRYRLAWDHDLCRAVVGRTMRAIVGFLRRRARDAGVTDGRGGAVAILQRFGGELNLNVHIHALVVDGVFAKDGESVRFHPCPSLHAADVDEVLATVEAYVQRRAGGGADAGNDGDDTLDAWAGAHVRRRGAGLAAAEPPAVGPCHARHNGFDLHAGLCVPADQRDRLERIARYALRPPVAQDRLAWTDAGQVRLELRRSWSDGTTHLLFDPVELLDVLACPRCGGRLTLIALIDDPAVIGRMLQHLELPTEVPEVRPARAPPALLLDGAPRPDAPDEFCVDDPA